MTSRAQPDQGGFADRRPAHSKGEEPKITQIAESMVGTAQPREIVTAILARHPVFAVAELAELLHRARELQDQAEALQSKAAIMMEVVAEVANSARWDRKRDKN
jgi:hypothetical protein